MTYRPYHQDHHIVVGDGFKWPTMKVTRFRALLERELGYAEVPTNKNSGGSHVKLEAGQEGRMPINWAFHPSRGELSPVEVKNILVKQVGLTLEEAKKIVRK